MYSIELRPTGFLLTFDGFIQASEMQKWRAEADVQLRKAPAAFGVIVDMRGLKPLPPDAKAIMQEGQTAFKLRGLTRSFVALNDAVTSLQFKKLAKESGVDKWERYADVSKEPNWQKIAVDWVKNNIDPGK
jgi:hypothetical protein